MDRQLSAAIRGKDVLEVGSYCGRSSICMGQTARSLCCVDPFDCRDTPGDGSTFAEFTANLKRYKVTPAKVLRSLFADAPLNGDRFDLVFIDGAHDEASVVSDAWRAIGLLRPEGLLAFHDYHPTPGHSDGCWWPGVTLAVNRLIAAGAQVVQTFGTVAVIRPAPGLKIDVMTFRNVIGVEGLKYKPSEVFTLAEEEDMIDQKTLINQLESLEKQRKDHEADLYRIDGAVQVVRGMLAREQQDRETAAKQQADEMQAVRNGVVCEGAPVEN